jgi:DNA-binding beta-propeller fold protein YncE
MRTAVSFLAMLILLALSACSSVQPQAARPSIEMPGEQADGAVRLPNQWDLRPVGKQIPLGDFPANIAVHPDGKFAAILHCGYGQNEITIIELPGGRLVCRTQIDESFYGLAFAPDGKTIFCSGAGDEVIHSFAFSDGYLAEHKVIRLHARKERGVPGGLCTSRDGKTLYVANVWGHRVSEVDLRAQEVRGEVLLGTNAMLTVALDANGTASEDEAAITKRT